MSWSRQRQPPPRGYHHGNLKEALMRAALELIGEKGPAGFTFAEAARWAGVSPAAPYRHFRDRDELLADVAHARLRAVRGRAGARLGRRPARSVDGVRAARQGLSAFAHDEPAYYSAMFEAGVPLDAEPGAARGGRPRLRGAARRRRAADRRPAGRQAPAGADDGAAHLGAVARRRRAVRPRRCRPPRAADVGRRSCWRPAC